MALTAEDKRFITRERRRLDPPKLAFLLMARQTRVEPSAAWITMIPKIRKENVRSSLEELRLAKMLRLRAAVSCFAGKLS